MEKQLIYEKVSKVMAEIQPIAKDRKNTQQGYKFRGIDDLMNALSPLVTKHGIFPATQSVSDVLHESVTSKGGGAGTHIIRRYTFRFYAEDGSFVDTMADGEAIDYGDKASNKAYSVAYREAMFKTFVIPFQNEDIEESDHDLKPPQPVAAPQQAARPPQTSQATEVERMKARVKVLCDEKSPAPLLTKSDYAEYVRGNTGLGLEVENLPEIINRLEAIQ